MIYYIVRFIIYLFLKIFCRIKYINKNLIPKTGFILASNHVSYYDPFAAGIGVKQKVSYMAKQELFDDWFTGPMLRILAAFPVKRGKVDRQAIKTALNILKNEGAVGMFPEGTRSQDGEVHKGEEGIALISIMSGKPILTAALIGTKGSIIKFPPRLKRIIVKYGELIYPENFSGSKKERMKQITNKVIESIKQIKKELEENGSCSLQGRT